MKLYFMHMLILVMLVNYHCLAQTNEIRDIENSVYAVIAVPETDIDSMEDEKVYEIKLNNGISGTCFFVAPNRFIAANHVFNKSACEKQRFFLINERGSVVNNVYPLFENTSCDLSVGTVDSKISAYASLPDHWLTFRRGTAFAAYGYSADESKHFRMVVTKEHGKLRIVDHDPLHLKRIDYNYIAQSILQDLVSRDSLVHLKNCDVIYFDTPLEIGFSGGPTVDTSTNQVIGFASQQAFDRSETAIMIVIPLMGDLEKNHISPGIASGR